MMTPLLSLPPVQEQEGRPEGYERCQQHQSQDQGPIPALLWGSRTILEQFPGDVDHAAATGLPFLLAFQFFQGIEDVTHTFLITFPEKSVRRFVSKTPVGGLLSRLRQ